MSRWAPARTIQEEGSTFRNGSPVMHSPAVNPDRIYRNDGNPALLALLDTAVRRILDVGCGAGDNARLLKSRHPACEVFGITQSAAEADIAGTHMTACWVTDIELELPADLNGMRFDAILFSHVLEHLRDPGAVLSKFARLLDNGGAVLIAVPNALSWAMRWQFLRGDFEYRSDGVLDDTHLRFFTYLTADRYLLRQCPELVLASKSVTGSVPQWPLRRYVLPRKWSACIDTLGCQLWPNLFGNQVLIKAIQAESDQLRLNRVPA